MASALAALANASIVFQVAKAGVVTDPATGNVSAVTETVTVSLFLREERTDVIAYPGIDVGTVSYSGYAIDPQTLDSRIVVGTTGTLTFGDEAGGEVTVKELRTPYGKSGLLGAALANALGERIVLVATGQR